MSVLHPDVLTWQDVDQRMVVAGDRLYVLEHLDLRAQMSAPQIGGFLYGVVADESDGVLVNDPKPARTRFGLPLKDAPDVATGRDDDPIEQPVDDRQGAVAREFQDQAMKIGARGNGAQPVCIEVFL